MADINRIKGNIQIMIEKGAPESDIDAYVSSEGVSLEELQQPREMIESNGVDVNVPQGISKEDFQNRIQTLKNQPRQAKPSLLTGLSQTTGEDLGSVARSMVNTVPLVGGFADEAQSALTGEKLENIQARDKDLESAVNEAPYAKTISTVGDAVAGIGMGGMAGKALGIGAKLGGLGSRSLTGAVEGVSRGEGISDRLVNSALGAGIGAVAPSLVKPVAKSVSKITKYVSPKVSGKLSKFLFKTTKKGGKDISDLASSDVDMKKLLAGADANKDVAKEISQKAKIALRNNHKRIIPKIQKTLGVNDIEKYANAGKIKYANYLKKNANKGMSKESLKEVLKNPKIKSTLNNVWLSDPKLRKLPINSLPVLQKANSEMLKQSRNAMNTESGFFDSASVELKDAMNKNFKGFKGLQKEYSDAIRPQKAVEFITNLKGRIGRDFAGSLDTIKTEDLLHETFGEGKTFKVQDILQKESDIAKNLRSLQIKGKSAQQGKGLRQVAKKVFGDTSNRLAGGVATVNPLMGGAMLGANIIGKGIGDKMAKTSAQNLLGKTIEELTPQTKALIAQQASKRLTQ